MRKLADATQDIGRRPRPPIIGAHGGRRLCIPHSEGWPISNRPATTIALFAMAAGRCEFDGCNRLLIEHHVTKEAGNYGEKAHIVAYEAAGPRGDGNRPADIHALENLMLLCPACHKHIDDNPENFSVETLRAYKEAHEARVCRLTELDKNHETKVVILKARIGGDMSRFRSETYMRR